MKQIPLTQGKFALVDDEDYERVNQFKWKTLKARQSFYANRTHWISFYSKKKNTTAKCSTIILHRFILGITDKNIFVDHIDHDGLNCQKYNLRACTNGENVCNTTSRKNSTSKYLGVSLNKKLNKWVCQIQKEGKGKNLGIFENEIDAAKAYNIAALGLFGEFANLNKI